MPPQMLSEALLAELAKSAPELFFVPRGGSLRVLRAKSIAYAKMGQQEFTALLNRMIDVTIKDVLPGVPRSDVVREIETIAGLRMSNVA